MKKILAFVLALVMCLGIFAGCGSEPAPTQAPETTPVETEPTAPDTSAEDLESAAAYVKALYKNAAASTPSSYQRIGAVRVGDVEYTVTWSVNVAEGIAKVVPNSDGTVTIEIGDDFEEETPYVLTATVSDASGKTASVEFNHYIPAPLGSQTDIVDMAYALEVGAQLDAPATLTGVITAIDTPYSPDYKNVTVIIQVEGREDKPIMCYRLKGEGADTIMPGDIITVTGMIKNYKGTIEFDAGCTLDKVVKGENSLVIPEDPKELVNMAYELGVGESIPAQVTLTGLIFAIDSPYSDRYNNISVWMVIEGMYDKPILAFRMKGADVDKIWEWDTITVTGTLKNYQGKIEFDAGCTLDSWVDTGLNPDYPMTQKDIVDALYNLKEGESFPGIYSLSGRVVATDGYEPNYGNQTITIECEGKQVIGYRMTTGGIDIKVGDYVTIRGNLEDYKGKKQVTSGYLTHYDETTLAEALEEAKGLANNTYLPYEKSATGTVKINTAYSAQYKNITFTITTADGLEVYCYRVGGYGMDQLVDGDVVTVTGKLTCYNGKPQFDKTASVSCERLIPQTLEDQLKAAASLANNTYLPIESTITGTVVINTAYSAQYKNITFTVTNSDGLSAYCYRVKGDGMDTLENGDTVTVTGKLTAYNGKAQFDSTAKVTVVSKGNGETPDVPETPTEPEKPTYNTFAEMVAAANKLANNAKLGVDVEVTGTVLAPEFRSSNGNWAFTLDVDGVQVYCYGLLDGLAALNEGDIVKVKGDLTAYNGKAQFSYATATATFIKAAEVTPEPEEPTDPSEPETPSETKTATFTFSFSATQTNDITAANLKNAFISSDLSAESASGITKVYQGNKESGQFQGTNFLKFSSSSKNGAMTVTFPSNVKITKVTVNAHAWNTSTTATLAINGISKTVSKSGAAADLSYELSTPSNSLTFSATKRLFLFSVTVEYTEG